MTDIAVLGVKVDPTGVVTGVKVSKDELSKLGQQAKRTEQGIDSSFGNMKKAARLLSTTFAGLSAALVAKDIVSTGKQFESAISDLSAITGATGQDLEFLATKAREFGAQTTLSATQAAEAFKLIASAKPDLLESGEALAAVTKEAIALAEASGTDLPAAAATLGTALNQFNADASEAGRFINVLAAGAKLGASEVVDTAEALKQSGVVARAAGVSFEELNASVQVLAASGLKASEAGTPLRNIISRLQTDVDKFNPSVVGLTKALENLAAENLSAEQIVKKFRRENLAAAQVLIDNASAVNTLTNAMTGTQIAYDQQATRVNNLEGDLKALNSAYEDLKIEIFNVFGPGLRTVAEALTDFTKGVKDNREAIQEGLKVVLELEKALLAIFVARTLGPVLGRLAISMQAFASATRVSAASLTTFSTSAAVASTQAKVLQTSMTTLNGAVGLLGGKAGVITLAATALLLWHDMAEKATIKTEEVTRVIKALRAASGLASPALVEDAEKTREGLEAQLDAQQRAVDQQVKNIEYLRDTYKGGLFEDILKAFGVSFTTPIEQATNKLEELQDALIDTKRNLRDLTEEQLVNAISAADLVAMQAATAAEIKSVNAAIKEREKSDVEKGLAEDIRLLNVEIKAYQTALEQGLTAQKASEAATNALAKATFFLGIEKQAAGAKNKEEEASIRSLAAEQWRQVEVLRALEDANKKKAASEEKAKQIIAATRDPLEEMIHLQHEATLLFQEGVLTAEQLYARHDQLLEDFNASRSKANVMMKTDQQKALDEIKVAAQGIGDNIKDAFVQMAETGKFQFSSMIDAIIADLTRLAAQKAIIDPLVNTINELFKPSGGGSDLFGTLLGMGASFLSGGPVTGIGDPAYAGEFAGGGSFRVGGTGGTDSQLVAFRASPNERVTVETPMQQQGRSPSVSVTNNFVIQATDGKISERSQMQTARAASAAVSSAVSRLS